jgi:hypothetical protein
MNIYATVRTEGNRLRHKKLFNMFNETYNTQESGHIGNGEYWSETSGTTIYNLNDKKYKKLLKLFNKHGFNKDIEYIIIYRDNDIKITQLNPDLTNNYYYDPIKAGDYIKTEIKEDIYGKLKNGSNILYNPKRHTLKAKSYIKFYNDIVYN